MAAQAQPRTPREVVDFPPNLPITLALKYNQGKLVAGQYGERMMFSLTDGRVMFLDPETAGKIEAAGINVRESFTITRKWDGVKGSPMAWEVARVAGEQPNGTMVVPALPAAVTPKAPAAAAQSSGVPRKPVASATELLISEANALVDAYAQVLERALTTYGGRVKPDEIKALLITSYIQRAKLSSVPCDPCHTGPHATSQKASDLTAIPLTRREHDQFDSDPRGFALAHGLDIPALIQSFNEAYAAQLAKIA